MQINTLRDFVNQLDKEGLLKHIKKECDPVYEIPTLMKMLDGTPLIFEKVKGQTMPVVANICCTRELVAKGMGVPKEEIIPLLANAIDNPKKAQVKPASGYREVEPDLSKLPILTYYPFDGGPYVASGIVVANDQEYGLNMSYHRTMIIDGKTVVQRILQRHFEKYIERGLKEFAFCIGTTIPVLVGASISTEITISEVDIANALRETYLVDLDGHLVPESEIVIIFEITGDMASEGPFLDLTETPDIVRSQRVSRVKKIFVREDAVFHGLLPGGLEHKVLMGMPREPTMWQKVSEVCKIKDVLVTPGGTSWLHGAVSIYKQGPDDGKKAIEAAFKGHNSMKHVFVVDEDIDIHDPAQLEWAMATRFQADKDLVIKPNEKGSSLDPSADPNTRITCKVGFDMTIPGDKDPKDFLRPALPMELDLDKYVNEC
ncbi:MAG: UbiD family decarboxylase [Candidatus Thermoplasmatota archaeon]|nr:UbiD family decarboxylase [Candidatus Thermoplasmatota archaeon]